MYKIVLMRHGESQWNLENRFTGWVDVDLTEKGREEAARAGEIREGGRPIADRAETGRIRILPAASASGKQQLSVGSGNYEFSFPAPGANS